MDEDAFYLNVSHALSGCQLIEQQLKLYITEALEFAKKCIGGKMPFKLDGEDYADASLERLIEMFRKLSDSDSLVSDLQRFKKERNFLSHRGITHSLDCEGELDESSATEFQERLAALQADARRLYVAIHEEANKFRGHLLFDDLTKG